MKLHHTVLHVACFVFFFFAKKLLKLLRFDLYGWSGEGERWGRGKKRKGTVAGVIKMQNQAMVFQHTFYFRHILT